MCSNQQWLPCLVVTSALREYSEGRRVRLLRGLRRVRAVIVVRRGSPRAEVTRMVPLVVERRVVMVKTSDRTAGSASGEKEENGFKMQRNCEKGQESSPCHCCSVGRRQVPHVFPGVVPPASAVWRRVSLLCRIGRGRRGRCH